MWHVLDVLSNIADIIDAIIHWRVLGCVLAGLALAYLLQRSFPGQVDTWVFVALAGTGAIVGALWERQA